MLVAGVLLGGLAGLSFPNLKGRVLHLVLSFSGAYLLSITALHLLPDAFATPGVRPGLAILLGFFLQVLFEQMSKGVEHGHIHVHEGRNVALTVLAGLSLHALLEGSPLAVDHGGHTHDHLLVGIALHKLPAGFALSVLLLQAGYSKMKIWLALAFFAAMSPVGALLAAELIDPSWMPYLLGLVVGSLLHVSTTILFELDDPHQHRLSWTKTAAVAVGMSMAIATSLI